MDHTHLTQRSSTRGIAFVGTLLAALAFGASSASAYTIDKKDQAIVLSSLADFDKCANELGNVDMCVAGLRSYVKKHQKEAFEAGKHVRLQMTHWAALEFFAQGFSGKGKTAERCADSDLSMAIVSGLSLPADYPALADAKKLSESCWEQVQPALLKALDEPGGYLGGNLCPLLAAKSVSAPKCNQTAEKPKPAAPSAAAQLKGIDWKALTIDPESARAFQGNDGQALLIARSKPNPRSFTLLKFKHVQGPWNEQVLVALERPGGVGTDYVIAQGTDEWVAVTEREGNFEGYVKGVKDGIRLWPVRAKEEIKVPNKGEIVSELSVKKK